MFVKSSPKWNENWGLGSQETVTVKHKVGEASKTQKFGVKHNGQILTVKSQQSWRF